MAWVQLLRLQQIEQGGVSRTYHPGDWVDVGRQTARRWVVDGVARFATPQLIAGDLSECGIVAVGARKVAAAALREKLPDLKIEAERTPTLRFAKTLLWQPEFALRPELVPVGFHLLAAWEAAAPVVSYEELACHIGTVEARERTQAIVRDLRVPLYDPRLVFVRRCQASRALLEAWAQERETGDDDRLCLLRAVYRVKPLICALPVTWNRAVGAIR